jgi:hypothetical protein
MRVLNSALVAVATAAVLITGTGRAAPANAASAISPGIYSIKNVGYITQVVDAGGETAVGLRENEGPRQRWDLAPMSDGYAIRNHATGSYLGVNGSEAVLQPMPTPWHLTLQYSGRFEIEAVGDGRALTLTDGQNGVPVALENYMGKINQQWYFQRRDGI